MGKKGRKKRGWSTNRLHAPSLIRLTGASVPYLFFCASLFPSQIAGAFLFFIQVGQLVLWEHYGEMANVSFILLSHTELLHEPHKQEWWAVNISCRSAGRGLGL